MNLPPINIVATALFGWTISSSTAFANQVPQTSPTNPGASCVTISTLTGAGSGFFLEQSGKLVVITCRHVVEHSPFLRITDMNGREHNATNVLLSTLRDIALLQIEGDLNDVLPLKTIDGAKDLIFDMDLSCYGDSEGKGVIVKSKGRLLGIGPESIETDAAIVPGNSGGPIVAPDTDKVIAVASYLTKTRSNQWNEGTRFEDAVRRFGIRIDNLDFSDSSLIRQTIVRSNNYSAIAQFGEQLLDSNNQELVPEAKACLEYAATHGDSAAKTVLARNYITGTNWKTNDEKGFLLAKEAAETGSVEAKYLLSQCLILGIGTTPDVSLGMHWLMESASNNFVIAQYDLGKDYLDGTNVIKNVDQGFFWISRSAKQGFGPAQARLGELYEEGIGTESNSVEAIAWYKKAAEAGDPDGLYNLGWCYLKGLVVEKDETKGNSYLEQAADAGNIDAQVFVGIGLQNGVSGFRKDAQKAFLLFQKAAQKNSKEGCRLLANSYEWGWGCEMNGKLAISNYINAGTLGDIYSLYYAGFCLSQGRLASGVSISKNFEAANDLLTIAANKGSIEAKSYLGRSLLKGSWLPKNETKAFPLLSSAASNGDADAMAAMGLIFYSGLCGQTPNKNSSQLWFQWAAEKGNQFAKEALRDYFFWD